MCACQDDPSRDSLVIVAIQDYPGMYTHTYPSVRASRDSLLTGLGLVLGLHSMSP